MVDAACAGRAPNKRLNPDEPDPWFPDKGQSPNLGKKVCFTCPVRDECKDYKQRTKSKTGMWAGEIERRGA